MKTNDIYVTPVKKYKPPKYPTHSDSTRTPELLRKLPPRWEKNAKVVAAAGMLGAITLTSCGIFEPGSTGYNPGGENFLNVAPIFVHGEGTGAMGCEMIAPPVFLSEQEAFAIIKGVAEDAGLNFYSSPPGYIATNNKPEQKSQYSWENSKYVLGGGNVGLDLYDSEKGVAAAYISMTEAEERYVNDKGETTMWSSVTGYRPKELAELTAGDFAKQKGDITVGVFYEPGTDWQDEEHKKILDEYYNSEKSWEEKTARYASETKELIEENLREQVRDFIEWLQGQGII